MEKQTLVSNKVDLSQKSFIDTDQEGLFLFAIYIMLATDRGMEVPHNYY